MSADALKLTRLNVRAAPFIQQDRRIGACAQAAIWMADRPAHERHGAFRWRSVAQITALATEPADADLRKALPHGSDGLTRFTSSARCAGRVISR